MSKRSLPPKDRSPRGDFDLLRQALDHADNAIVVLDGAGRVFLYNERYLDMWGFERSFLESLPHIEECIHRACRHGIYPPEREDELIARRRADLAAQSPRSRLETPRLDGTVVEGYVSPLPEGGHLLTFRDVTEQHRARGVIEENEARYRTIMGAMEDPVFIVSSDFRVEYMNPSMVDRTGRDATGEVCYTAFYERGEPCPGCTNGTVIGERRRHVRETTNSGDGRTSHVSEVPLPHPDGSASKLVVIRDITERKRSEQSLRQQVAFTEGLVQNSAVATFVIDRDHRVLYWNRACEELTGLLAGAVVDTDEHWRAFYPAKRPCLADLVVDGEEQRGQELYPSWGRSELAPDGLNAEGWYEALGGRDRYIVFDAAPIRGEGGNLVGAVETLQDITERKLAEEAVERSLSLLASTLESTADGVLAVDLAGRVTRANGRLAEMWGMPRDLVVKADHDALLRWLADQVGSPEDLLARTGEFSRHPEAESFDAVELLDGRIFERYSIPQKIGGVPVGRVWNFRDVTERVHAQSELTLLARVVDQGAEAVIVTDAGGRVSYVNPAFEDIAGVGGEEVLGRELLTVLYPTDEGPARATLGGSLDRGESWSGRVRFEREGGAEREAACRVSSLCDENGTHVNWVALVLDITREAELERQVALSQKLQAIGTLAGGIAHDFNNLLTVILGSTELAMDDAPEESVAARNLARVLQAGERARDLVRQILTFSRQEAEGRKPTRIQPVVEEVLDFLQASAPPTMVIRRELAAPEAVVLADPSQVSQILLNLCTNALHSFGDRAGILEVALEETWMEDFPSPPSLREGGHLLLRVSDNGCGMSPEVLGRVFDPFFTTKEVGQGTGLGLSVVHGIVEAHGGSIQVESSPEQGTTFRIYLPLRGCTPGDQDLSVRTPEEAGGKSILFVDDEELLAELGQQMLESLGYRAVMCRNGADALEVFRDAPESFDVVLTDQLMPGMTGEVLAAAIHGIRPDIPILLCTGFSDVLSPERALAAGILEVLAKPIRRHEIAAVLARVLGGHPQRSHPGETNHGTHPGRG